MRLRAKQNTHFGEVVFDNHMRAGILVMHMIEQAVQLPLLLQLLQQVFSLASIIIAVVALVFTLKRKPPAKLPTSYDERLEALEKAVTELRERLGEVERVRAELTTLKERARALAKPIRAERYPEIGRVSSLSDIKSKVAAVKFVCLMTSQGYSIEQAGEEPKNLPGLLEIVRVSNRFFGEGDVTIEGRDETLSIFKICTIGDLNVYGLVLLKKPYPSMLPNMLKNTIKRYFEVKGG